LVGDQGGTIHLDEVIEVMVGCMTLFVASVVKIVRFHFAQVVRSQFSVVSVLKNRMVEGKERVEVVSLEEGTQGLMVEEEVVVWR
jgi:hypothetical protein